MIDDVTPVTVFRDAKHVSLTPRAVTFPRRKINLNGEQDELECKRFFPHTHAISVPENEIFIKPS